MILKPYFLGFIYRLSKAKDQVGCRLIMESIHCKFPLFLRFISDEDDDVSAELSKSSHDYVTMLKSCVPLNDVQKQTLTVSTIKIIHRDMLHNNNFYGWYYSDFPRE